MEVELASSLKDGQM